MQWMTMTSFVPCHALHAPQHAAASPFGPYILQQVISSLFFKYPSSIFILDQSRSGKTEFVKKKKIEYRVNLFNILPLHIMWCYKEWQSVTRSKRVKHKTYSWYSR